MFGRKGLKGGRHGCSDARAQRLWVVKRVAEACF